MTDDWSIDSWTRRPARQQAAYDDPDVLKDTLERLAKLPPIVTSWEIVKLKQQLGEVARGERFLVQGGDCSERFEDCRAPIIEPCSSASVCVMEERRSSLEPSRSRLLTGLRLRERLGVPGRAHGLRRNS